VNDKVLFVDDEENILQAYRRILRNRFSFHSALSGVEALEILNTQGPFAVVISDYRMPRMDGITFLSTVNQLFPDTVRMMLTGYADLETAMYAVNLGYIFRFMTKPCKPEALTSAVEAGLKQFQLINVERELLEKTLSSSIKVLIEILSLVNPVAFSRSLRLQQYVRHIVKEMNIRDSWQYEVAALLSQIGCVTLPPEILEKSLLNMMLSHQELKMLNDHPRIGAELLAKIPRLEEIAGMIAAQNDTCKGKRIEGEKPAEGESIAFGGDILRVAVEFDQLMMRKFRVRDALAELRRENLNCNPNVVNALSTIRTDAEDKRTISIYLRELKPGMILQDHIRASNTGMLLATKGQQVTPIMLERLNAFARTVGIDEPFYVTT